MTAETIFPMLASLCGLVAFVIVVVGVIRFIDSRTSRPAHPAAVQPGTGPTTEPRSFAGCGLVGLLLVGTPAGLLVFGFAVPAWLKEHPNVPAWVGDYVAPVGAIALWVVLLVALVGVLRGLRRPKAPPVPGVPVAAPRMGGMSLYLFVGGMAAWVLLGVVGKALGLVDFDNPPSGSGILVMVIYFMVIPTAICVPTFLIAAGEWNAVQKASRQFYNPGAAGPGPTGSIPASPAPAGDCPRCGQPIPPGSPQGLCPRCLLQGVMPSANQPSPTLAFVEAYIAPTVEEVAKLFPPLEVKELIGQGGMGAVYLARQKALDRLVALKLVRPREADPTFAERFVREAKAMARLNHPHVVAVYESGEASGLPYLILEYVDGVTLRDAMRERALSPAEALAIVPQICDALEYAHSQGVVHRDVKPENILLGRDGRVKIADFGLAKVTDPAGVSLTGTRQAMGTPHYMAPEQWEKPGEVDHRADIYALGVVLYELLTGELPIGRFDPPSQKIRLDIRLDEVVLRALAKEPDRRYQHASDVKTALDAIRSGASGWVRTPTFREYRSKRTFLSWPLVHIVSGLDPLTGRPKTAKGWLAIGDSRAVGGFAMAGGFAAGGVAISGGFSLGVLSVAGGFAFGGFALAGGMAFAAAVATAGGFAIAGVLAVAGGFAGGTFAAGSSARGAHVVSATRHDADFADALANWVNALWPF
jgi:tRNA A-37 threonylcarbamoyl transferase component Bud32